MHARPRRGPNEAATASLAADLTAERERIDRAIADLQRTREILDEVIEAAAPSRV